MSSLLKGNLIRMMMAMGFFHNICPSRNEVLIVMCGHIEENSPLHIRTPHWPSESPRIAEETTVCSSLWSNSDAQPFRM